VERGAGAGFAVVPGSALLGRSPAMARVHSLIARAGRPTPTSSCSARTAPARNWSRASSTAVAARRTVMLTVDLGAVAEDLIDSELFGHVKGAFTDARADRVGRIQAADGGTLFLDEIGNLPLRLQPKLLTVLEQRQVTPVGANKPVPVDIRVIAATNLPPEKLRDESHFRQDLLFRLNTVEIDLPPLRERLRGRARADRALSRSLCQALWPPAAGAERRGARARCSRTTGPAMSARCATRSSAQ
jgi:transcriptional regulator of acetoin/glycerol metabolism